MSSPAAAGRGANRRSPPPPRGAVDRFGEGVAGPGDAAGVGALGGDVGADAEQGPAHVFPRGGGVWTQQQKLTAPDGAAADAFGGAVAVSVDTAVIGAY